MKMENLVAWRVMASLDLPEMTKATNKQYKEEQFIEVMRLYD